MSNFVLFSSKIKRNSLFIDQFSNSALFVLSQEISILSIWRHQLFGSDVLNEKNCRSHFKRLNYKFACPFFIARGVTLLIANQLSTRFCFDSIRFRSRKNSIKEKTMKRSESRQYSSLFSYLSSNFNHFTFAWWAITREMHQGCISLISNPRFFPIGIILTWCDFNLFRPTYLCTVKMSIWSLFGQWKAIFAFWWY